MTILPSNCYTGSIQKTISNAFASVAGLKSGVVKICNVEIRINSTDSLATLKQKINSYAHLRAEIVWQAGSYKLHVYTSSDIKMRGSNSAMNNLLSVARFFCSNNSVAKSTNQLNYHYKQLPKEQIIILRGAEEVSESDEFFSFASEEIMEDDEFFSVAFEASESDPEEFVDAIGDDDLLNNTAHHVNFVA